MRGSNNIQDLSGKGVETFHKGPLAILCPFLIMFVWGVSFSMLIYYNEYIKRLGVTLR